jgi:hypothetical protein
MMTTGTFALPLPTTAEECIEALGSSDAWRVREAFEALEADVPAAIPALAATLRDRSVMFPIRRRVTLLLGGAPTPAARDALVAGLGDPRFEIRYRCGRALARVVAADPSLAPTADEMLAVVSREVDVSRRVWDDRHLVSLLSDEGPRALLGEVLQERTDRSLEHVFGLLALCLPSEPLLAAFRGLQSEDLHLRGTALDYLEFMVPAEIRRKLWQILESDAKSAGGTGDHESAQGITELDDLLRDQQSIALRVDELRRERSGGEV